MAATHADAITETARQTSAIGRIVGERMRWRVLVETWPTAPGYEGRLLFSVEENDPPLPLEGPATLHGATREDVLRSAYEISEEHLRTLLRSLSVT